MLFGDGSRFGGRIEYREQPQPLGIAQAFFVADTFIGDDSVALILGDNIFSGSDVFITAFEKLLLEIQTFKFFQAKMPTVEHLEGLIKISPKELNAELNQLIKLGLLDAAKEYLEELRLLRNSTIKIRGESMVRILLIGEKTKRLRKFYPGQLKNEHFQKSKLIPDGLHFAMDVNTGCLGISQIDWAPR